MDNQGKEYRRALDTHQTDLNNSMNRTYYYLHSHNMDCKYINYTPNIICIYGLRDLQLYYKK